MTSNSRLKSQRGDLGLTLAIASLVFMVVGSIVGTRVADKQALNTSSSAASCTGGAKSNCGGSCGCNSDCNRLDSDLRFELQCDLRSRTCVPSSSRNSCSGGTPKVDVVKRDIGQACSSDADCKSHLLCSSRTRTCFDPNSSGGGFSPGQPAGAICTNHAQCASRNCTSGRCSSVQAPTSTFGGGSGRLPGGSQCTLPTQCQSGSCVSGVCSGGVGGPGGGVVPKPTGGSCTFQTTASVKFVNSSGREIQVPDGVSSWSIRNTAGAQGNFSSNGIISAGGPISGEYCCGTDNTEAGYRAGRSYKIGDPATVTLNFDSSKYRVVSTFGPGSGGSSATITGLPTGCGTYSYGWTLTCVNAADCGGDDPGHLPQPTLKSERFMATGGICEASFQQVQDPHIYKIEVGPVGGPVLLTIDENTRRKSGDLTIPFEIGDKNERVQINFDPRRQPDVAVTVHNPSFKQGMYDRQGLIGSVLSGRMVVTIHYFFMKGTGSERHEERHTQSVTTSGGCVSGPTPTTVTPTATVVPPSPTPTVLTPTPTTPSPSPTPTPPVCKKDIYFLIDNSMTQRANLGGISTALDNYFDAHPDDEVTISYDTFNRRVEAGGSARNTINFNVPPKRWTNINAALDAIRSNGADIKVFISDGIPSVRDAAGFQCTFHTGGRVLSGCDPLDFDDSPGRRNFTENVQACADKYTGGDIAAYRTACGGEPYVFGTGGADHSVALLGAEGMGGGIPAAGGRVHNGLEPFLAQLPEMLDALCGRTQNAGGGAGAQSASIGYSMSIENNSDSKTVESVSIDLCDASNNCDSRKIDRTVGPGQSAKTNDVFSKLLTSPILESSTYDIKCTVNYEDGQTQECGVGSIAGNNGMRYKVSIDDSGADAQPETYVDASDFDGNCSVNTLDYVRFLKQSESVTAGVLEQFDIVLDDKINAQDRSVVINNMGKSCSSQ